MQEKILTQLKLIFYAICVLIGELQLLYLFKAKVEENNTCNN